MWLFVIGYLLAGWAIRQLGSQWDINEPRVQMTLTGLLMVTLMVVTLWIDEAWSVPVAGLAVVHVGLTGVTLWVIRTSVAHG